MINTQPLMKPGAGWISAAAVMMFVFGALPGQALAQAPARFYWDQLTDGHAVPLIFQSVSGNTNPFDPSLNVTPGAEFEATLALAGYARTFALFDRSAMAAILLPVGRVSGDASLGGIGFSQSASGFGDPMLEFNINLLGPPAQRTLPDALRYEPGLSIDLLIDVALPIGEYDNDQALNIGQNRWYGRVGAPIILQLGPWVPGRRTTLELLPAVWLFGNNDDFVGQTLETDPLFQLDAHLTRDFTESIWASLDAVWYAGGKGSIDGVEGDSLNNFGVGFTIGYQINENLSLTFGYKSTLGDDDPGDLQLDGFMVSLVYGWNPLIEGVRRLEAE